MSDQNGWQAPGGGHDPAPHDAAPGTPAVPTVPQAPPTPPPTSAAAPSQPPGAGGAVSAPAYPTPPAHPAYPAQPGFGHYPAAAQPGIVPLRPLDLSDVLGGAFRVLRFNPRATVVFSVLVNLVALALVVPAMWWSFSTALDTAGATDSVDAAMPSLASNAAQVASSIVSALATFVLAVVTSRAVLGERVRTGEAWRQARPSLWRYLGLLLLTSFAAVAAIGAVIGLGIVLLPLGVVLGIVAAVAGLVLAVRWSLAGNALVLERLGVVAALRRSWALTRGQFWRVLGIEVLAGLVTSLISGVVAMPFMVAAAAVGFALGDPGRNPGPMAVAFGVAMVVASTLAAAVVTPVSSAITTLLYVDQRMRKEGFDVTLAQAAAARAPQER